MKKFPHTINLSPGHTLLADIEKFARDFGVPAPTRRGRPEKSMPHSLRALIKLGLHFENMYEEPAKVRQERAQKQIVLCVDEATARAVADTAAKHDMTQPMAARFLVERGLWFAKLHLPTVSEDGKTLYAAQYPLDFEPLDNRVMATRAYSDAEMRRMEAESCGRYAYQPDGTRVDLWLFQDAEWRREYAPATVKNMRYARYRQWKEDMAARRAARGD